MKNPGESNAGGNEPNFDVNNTVQAPERPRGFFRRIGDKISDIVESHNRQMQDKQALETVAEIKRLSRSGDEEDKRRLLDMRTKLATTGNIDDRVLNALLNSFDDFDSSCMDLLLENGADSETILKNEHVRDLALGVFEDALLENAYSYDDVDVKHNVVNWFFCNRSHDDTILQPILEDVFSDEDARKKFLDRVGEDTVKMCGDRIFSALQKNAGYLCEDSDTAEIAVSKTSFLTQLGYGYFNESRDYKITHLLGDEDWCTILDRLGEMKGDVVSDMYRAKAEALVEYSKNGLNLEEQPSPDDKEELETSLFIPDWLEPEEGDEMAAYWKEQDKKCGFDTMVFSSGLMLCHNFLSERYSSSPNTDCWTDQLTPGERFFSEVVPTMLKNQFSFAAKDLAELLTVYSSGYNSDLMTFSAVNLERIENINAKGIVESWKRIQTDNPEETEKIRLAFLKYASRGESAYIRYDTRLEGLNERKLFDENGYPTEELYTDDDLYFNHGKTFMPYIDENWESHFSKEQLAAFDVIEEFPDFQYRDFLSIDYEEQYLNYYLKENPEACRGLAIFSKTCPKKVSNEVRELITAGLNKYFDRNGLKPDFAKMCLSSHDYKSLLIAPDKDYYDNLDIDEVSKQFISAIYSPDTLKFPLDSSNIISAFTRYLVAIRERYPISEVDSDIVSAFWGPDSEDLADLVTDSLRNCYEEYLHSEDGTEFPLGLSTLLHYMREKRGAHYLRLKRVEDFLEFAGGLALTGEKGKAVTATIEERMKNDHWGNQEKMDFYKISAEIMQTLPEFYADFAESFTSISDKDMFEVHTRGILSLYQFKMSLSSESKKSDEIVEDDDANKELLLSQLRDVLSSFSLQESSDKRQESVDIVYETIQGEITDLLKARLASGDLDSFSSIDRKYIDRLDDTSKQIALTFCNDSEPLNFPLDSSNILLALSRFIYYDACDWYEASENDLEIREAFSSIEAKDLALDSLKKLYDDYLNGDDKTEFPVGLSALSRFMGANGGAGPLVQIEAFLDFTRELSALGEKGKALTSKIEERMQKDHWDNQEKTNFYAISAEMIQASPEIYREFAELFTNIKDKKDFETFTQEIYPLYRAKLALLRNYDESSDGVGNGRTKVNYDGVDKEALLNQLHNALLPFNLQELSPDKRREGIGRVREIILGEITDLFRDKLGIRPEAIPDNFDKSDIRIIQDMTMYLSNFKDPTPLSRNLIGLFLALNIGDKSGWGELRKGSEIDPGVYLDLNSEGAEDIRYAMQTSRENDPVSKENTGIIDDERLGEFKAALQEDVSNMRLGSAQTIDLRLQNLIGNIEDLTDPDLYPDENDKKKITIFDRYPSSSVNYVVTKMWQRADGRDIQFSDEEQAIVDDLTKYLGDQNIELTKENINKYLQVGFKAIQIPFSIRQTVKDSRAMEAIAELQKLLMPGDEVSRIFTKAGENFRPNSGAMALGADLDYLENLVVKHDKDFTDNERSAVAQYIGSIRTKMAELQVIYDKITRKFEQFAESVHGAGDTQLQGEIDEVNKIIHGTNTQTVITTTCTNSLTTIIENMRACLSAKTKGINNDTNLTFGEGYKFYLYSGNGTQVKGSNSDEIVFLISGEHDGERSLCFVMDQVYGHKNRDVFASHIETVLKKATMLKKQFPEVPITVFIPNSTSQSCSVVISSEELSRIIDLPPDSTISDTSGTFSLPRSGYSDHYAEFVPLGDERKPGEYEASGIEIVL